MLDKAKEVMEAGLELAKSNPAICAAVGVGIIVAGGVATYKLGQRSGAKKVEASFEERLQAALEQA